ncbi:MAG: hypothetical protein ACP5I3_11235 [Thermoproteus sp.]
MRDLSKYRKAMLHLLKLYIEEEYGWEDKRIGVVGAEDAAAVDAFSDVYRDALLLVNPFSYAVPLELFTWAFSAAPYVAVIESREPKISYALLDNYFNADLNLAKLLKLAGGGLLSYDPIRSFVVAVAKRNAPSEVEPRLLTEQDVEEGYRRLKSLGADVYIVSSAAVKGYALWDLDYIIRGRGCRELAEKIRDLPPTDLVCPDEEIVVRNKWGRGWKKIHIRFMNDYERKLFQ